ncbi:hypothetical protein H8959_009185 [Pygathrix nigripes]
MRARAWSLPTLAQENVTHFVQLSLVVDPKANTGVSLYFRFCFLQFKFPTVQMCLTRGWHRNYGSSRGKDQPALNRAEEEVVQRPADAESGAASEAPVVGAVIDQGLITRHHLKKRASSARANIILSGKKPENSSSRSGFPRKRRQPWKWKPLQSRPGLVNHSSKGKRRQKLPRM